eukprot:gene24801-31181_t
MAFVNLYPYGEGGPDNDGHDLKMNGPYVTSLLNIGRGREFQQSPNFIFYAYSWKMKMKVGTVSWLATRNGTDEVDPADRITVEDCKEFLEMCKTTRSRNPTGVYNATSTDDLTSLISETRMWKLLSRLHPFSAELPGSEMYMVAERKKLLSMISSPATTSGGIWQFFFTECQPDTHLSEIYDNAITSVSPLITSLGVPWYAENELRESHSDMLNKSQRAKILRDHPYLSARLHALQQTAFWDCIIMGKHQPFGKVVDFWRRVEFQLRGTPHSHNLICIARSSTSVSEDSLLNPDDPIAVAPVLSLVNDLTTACLQPRAEGDVTELSTLRDDVHEEERKRETEPNFNPDRATYFQDATHPGRQRFTAVGRDFRYNKRTGKIVNLKVQSLYRRLQIANQLHSCRNSCYKYCKYGAVKKCRYGFPKPVLEGNTEHAVIRREKDRRSRLRIKVEPARNNRNLNVSSTNPLIALACRGNHDIQYMANSFGGAEYVSKYASKADAPDSKGLLNVVNRKLASATLSLSLRNESLTLRQTLRIVGNAVATSQQIGAVHACYVLAQPNALVQSSRVGIFLNAFARKEIAFRPLEFNGAVLEEMDQTDSAVRDSPSTQLGRRDAYHAFVLEYLKKEPSAPRGASSKIKVGLPYQLYIDEESGENSERAAFALLLLHGNWGEQGEAGLLGDCVTAGERYVQVRMLDEEGPKGGGFPPYVLKSLERRIASETLLADTGTPLPDETVAATIDEFDAILNEQDDELFDRPQFMTYNSEDSVMEAPPPLLDQPNRVLTNCSASHIAYLGNFIAQMKHNHKLNHTSKNICTEEEKTVKIMDPSRVIAIESVDAERDALEQTIRSFNKEQRHCFNAAQDCISGADPQQMVMFVSGEGGTGKSFLIHALTKYTQILYGKSVGWFGSVLKTAPTGGAAFNIGGHTWHSALGKSAFKKKWSTTDKLSDNQVISLQKNLQGRFDKPFGGIHTLLAGDFYQMKPVGGTPIVEQLSNIPRSNREALEGKKIFSHQLTHFVMLKENVRAQTSGTELSQLAQFTRDARVGKVYDSDVLEIMNKQVVNSAEVAMKIAHPNAIWITSTHRRINDINAAFLDVLSKNPQTPRTRLVANHLPSKPGIEPPSQAIRDKLYGMGGGAQSHGGRADECGLYNGAMGTVWGFAYKGAGPQSERERMPSDFGSLEDSQRELPIVLVRID